MIQQMKDLSGVRLKFLYTTISNLLTFYFIIDVRNWFSNIEQHASEGVNKILIGNKCDMEDKRVSFLA
jgi:hypothetical protein